MRLQGYFLVVTAAACFGSLGMFSRLFFDGGGDPFELLFLRFAAMGPLLLLIALWRGERLPGRGAALAAVAMGILQFGAGYALFEGFARAPVGLIVLLVYIYPLLVTLGAVFLLKEEFGRLRLGVLGLGLGGIALTAGTPGTAPMVGIALGLVAGVCIAGSILSARVLMTTYRVTPLMLTALMFLSPAAVLAVVGPIRGLELNVSAGGWAAVAGTIIVSGIIPIAFFYTGVKLIGAGTSALLGTLEPVVGVLLAYAVLDESLGAGQLAGGALIIIAVVMLGVQTLRLRAAARAPA